MVRCSLSIYIKGGFMKIKKFLLSIVALVLVFLMSFSIVGCDKSGSDNKNKRVKSAKSIVRDYLEAEYINMSSEDYYDCIHEKLVELWCEEDGGTRQELIDEDQADYYDDFIDEMNNEYEEWSYSYKILEEIEPEDVDDLYDYYEDELDLEVEEIKAFEVEVYFEYILDGEKSKDVDFQNVYVGKIDGKWYLVD